MEDGLKKGVTIVVASTIIGHAMFAECPCSKTITLGAEVKLTFMNKDNDGMLYFSFYQILEDLYFMVSPEEIKNKYMILTQNKPIDGSEGNI